MTAITGIVGDEWIVFVSDSQNTDGNIKRFDYQKLHVINFDGDDVLIAESGASAPSADAVDRFKREAVGKKIDDYRKPAEMVQQIVKQKRRELIEGLALAPLGRKIFKTT